MYVFVYGTLKRGEPNSSLMVTDEPGSCQYIGEGITAEKYPLIVASRYNIPFLLYRPGTGHHVSGEVYRIDDTKLVLLDELEDHPTLYERLEVKINVKVKVKDDAGGSKVKGSEEQVTAWCYFLVKYRESLLQGHEFFQMYTDGVNGLVYDKEGDHAEDSLDYMSDVHTEF